MKPADGNSRAMNPHGDWGCYLTNGKMTGMAYNSKMSGKKLEEVSRVAGRDILIFEIEAPRPNAHAPFRSLDPEKSPMITIGGATIRRGWQEMRLDGIPTPHTSVN